jgi:hypothetical protein
MEHFLIRLQAFRQVDLFLFLGPILLRSILGGFGL